MKKSTKSVREHYQTICPLKTLQNHPIHHLLRWNTIRINGPTDRMQPHRTEEQWYEKLLDQIRTINSGEDSETQETKHHSEHAENIQRYVTITITERSRRANTTKRNIQLHLSTNQLFTSKQGMMEMGIIPPKPEDIIGDLAKYFDTPRQTPDGRNSRGPMNEDILQGMNGLRDNNGNAYIKFLEHFLKNSIHNIQWKNHHQNRHISQFIQPSLEAFIVIVYCNA